MEVSLETMKDSTSHSTERDQVLFWAAQLAGPGVNGGAEYLAQERGWLDANGLVTAAGHDLLSAFADQSGTRSVFRPMY